MSDPITLQMEHLRRLGYSEETIQSMILDLLADDSPEPSDEELETFTVEYGGEEVRRL